MRIAFVMALFLVAAALPAADERLADALSYLQAGELDSASKRIEEVLKDDPKSQEALIVKGRLLILQGKYNDGAEILFKIVEADPKRTDLYQYIGDAAFREKAWPDALEGYARFLKSTKDGRDAYLKVVYCKVAMREFSEAGRMVNSFDPLDATHPGYFFGKAVIAAAMKKPAEADSYLVKAKTLFGLPTYNKYLPDYLFALKSLDEYLDTPKPRKEAPAPASSTPESEKKKSN